MFFLLFFRETHCNVWLTTFIVKHCLVHSFCHYVRLIALVFVQSVISCVYNLVVLLAFIHHARVYVCVFDDNNTC